MGINANDVDTNGFLKIGKKSREYAQSVKVRIGIDHVKYPRNNPVSSYIHGNMTYLWFYKLFFEQILKVSEYECFNKWHIQNLIQSKSDTIKKWTFNKDEYI